MAARPVAPKVDWRERSGDQPGGMPHRERGCQRVVDLPKDLLRPLCRGRELDALGSDRQLHPFLEPRGAWLGPVPWRASSGARGGRRSRRRRGGRSRRCPPRPRRRRRSGPAAPGEGNAGATARRPRPGCWRRTPMPATEGRATVGTDQWSGAAQGPVTLPKRVSATSSSRSALVCSWSLGLAAFLAT